jgi:hypothetical protein
MNAPRLPDLIANCLKSPNDLAQLLQRRGLIHSAAFEDPEHYDSGKTMHAVMQLLADIQEAAAPSTPAGNDALTTLKAIAEMPEYDQDDVHRLRNIARQFFKDNPATAAPEENPVNRGAFWERTKESPREKALAETWEKENVPTPFLGHGQGLLQDLFSKPGRFGHIVPERTLNITNRDRMIAATVIQWLGSNCGFSMLMEALGKCGFMIVDKNGFKESSSQLRRLRQLAENMEIALTPRRWKRETYDAWHSSIPDTHLAFAHLRQFAFQQTEQTVTAFIHAERQKPAAELPAVEIPETHKAMFHAKPTFGSAEGAELVVNAEMAFEMERRLYLIAADAITLTDEWIAEQPPVISEVLKKIRAAATGQAQPPPASPSCLRCGEKLKGAAALTATLCGLCADDEVNATNP